MSFADVLDVALGRAPGEPARCAAPALAWASGGHQHAAPVFLFTRPLTSAVPRWSAPSGARTRRPDHVFTDAERQAFNRLLDLGACLEANFSADELRHEYRRLAQRYHPDRHADGSAVEHGRLTRAFADLAERCRCLRGLVEPSH